jgi:hypothetical protein
VSVATRSPARPSLLRLQPLLPWLLATWFLVISAMWLATVASGGPGFDGRLYRSATVAWLAGGDPWSVVQGGVWFGAPPPSLLPMIPFTILPEPVAVGALLVLGVAASAWAIRRLGLPWWWLAFPPLVDGLWNANPHVFVMPLIVAGLTPLAVVVKVYAGIVPVIRTEIRVILMTAAIVVATVPFLPWATYLSQRELIQHRLDLTAGGGLSVWALPGPLIPVGIAVALLSLLAIAAADRNRAAWLAMPVLWPWTQWYYSSMAIPGVAGSGSWMIGAAILAVPVEGGPFVAVAVCAAALVLRRHAQPPHRGRSDPP